VVFFHRLKGRFQKLHLHAPQHPRQLRREPHTGPRGRLQALVGQKVVVQDLRACGAQRMQHQSSGKTGAVLAGGAMKHRGLARFKQQTEKLAKAPRVVMHETPVGVLHMNHDIGCSQGLAGRHEIGNHLHDGRLDRQSVHLHAGQRANSRQALALATKINHTPNA
jgi:hypothetical protein